MASRKWKPRYDGQRKFRSEWSHEFPWISKSSDGGDAPYCKLCRKVLAVRKAAIIQHHKTDEHKKRENATNNSRKITFPSVSPSVEVKKVEMELAASVCCHCSVHLSEIVKKHGTGSALANIRLHRTKCSKIIHQVLSKSLFEEFMEDVRNKPFSLICDESTDISSDKHMCALVIFFYLD